MEIFWQARALADLRAVQDYIAEDNPRAARQTARRIIDAVDRLGDTPMIGRPGRIVSARELVVAGTPFIVPYRVRDDAVEILRVLHAARKWPTSL